MQASSKPRRALAQMNDQDPMLWQSDALRESFLAPQIFLHQALTATGHTASGVGETALQAKARAVAETAEIAALQSANATQLPRRFLPTRDGIAAAETQDVARHRALLEACERRGISDWWLGQAAHADRLSSEWVRRAGLATWLADMRAGADLRRTTALWRVRTPVPVSLVVARSIGAAGQSPMLGYGCAPSLKDAASKALRELLLMEICVMDDYVAQAFGTPLADNAPRRQMADFASRIPELLPHDPDVAPEDHAPQALMDGAQPIRAIVDWLTGPVAFTRLEVPTTPLEVAVCQPLGSRPVLMAGPGSPFVGPTPKPGGEA